MVDNVKVNPSTARSAIDVATDEIDGTHHPQYKVEFGADGTATPVEEDNPLPVTAGNYGKDIDSRILEALTDITVEMKIMNAYMAKVFDEIITNEDIEK